MPFNPFGPHGKPRGERPRPGGCIKVVAMAVFDVSRFLLEEEVFRNRELGSPTEARVTLTKFFVIISIAVSLEALVFIFDAAKKTSRC